VDNLKYFEKTQFFWTCLKISIHAIIWKPRIIHVNPVILNWTIKENWNCLYFVVIITNVNLFILSNYFFLFIYLRHKNYIILWVFFFFWGSDYAELLFKTRQNSQQVTFILKTGLSPSLMLCVQFPLQTWNKTVMLLSWIITVSRLETSVSVSETCWSP
jgi:hypothetical protein